MRAWTGDEGAGESAAAILSLEAVGPVDTRLLNRSEPEGAPNSRNI